MQAGAARAQAGDYLRALALVAEARARLIALAALGGSGASAAHADLDEADGLIAAINTIARASM